MILSICDVPDILKVMRIVNLVITIIKVVVPIILIVSAMIDLVRAINDSELNKISKPIVNKVIAAILVFLIPTFVKVIANITLNNSEYENCLGEITLDTINNAYIKEEDNLVQKSEESLDINDYNNANYYLTNIKDENKRKEYSERLKEVKNKIDEKNKKTSSSSTASSGLGKEIVPTEELITACNWVLNQENVNIRLQTCSDSHRYKNPNIELPGGATELSDRDVAKETINLYEYSKGVFFGEEKIEVPAESRYAFVIIYRTVILHNTVHYAIRAKRDPLSGAEITYRAGSCSQNYRNSHRQRKYDSGQYKAEIDDAVNKTKYLILVNDDGNTTDARYHSYTGIEQQIESSGRAGKTYLEILEDIKSGNQDSAYYRKSHVYDCRNLLSK